MSTIPNPPAMKSLGQYLIDRLYELGVRHMFGIPGDYVLSFFKLVEQSPIEMVVTTTLLATRIPSAC